MKNIEVEHRARFDVEKYSELKSFLEANAEDLGEDNRETHFFVFKDKFFKITNCLSKGTAKICLKMNKIGNGAEAEETEVEIKLNDVPAMVKIFKETAVENIYVPSNQLRHNYEYKGVELALKYSEEWGHHLELEVMIDDIVKKLEAENLIKKVSDELSVKIMSDQELKDLTNLIEAKYR